MFENGYLKDKMTLPSELGQAVSERDWSQVDRLCSGLIAPSGALFHRLFPMAQQSRMEFIINVRDSQNPWEEDGIWHDDGSRILAFTLGLNLCPEKIEGGRLLIRKKGHEDIAVIGPPAYGDLVVFKTGVDGFEHKVEAVTNGLRAVMAGWCYK